MKSFRVFHFFLRFLIRSASGGAACSGSDSIPRLIISPVLRKNKKGNELKRRESEFLTPDTDIFPLVYTYYYKMTNQACLLPARARPSKLDRMSYVLSFNWRGHCNQSTVRVCIFVFFIFFYFCQVFVLNRRGELDWRELWGRVGHQSARGFHMCRITSFNKRWNPLAGVEICTPMSDDYRPNAITCHHHHQFLVSLSCPGTCHTYTSARYPWLRTFVPSGHAESVSFSGGRAAVLAISEAATQPTRHSSSSKQKHTFKPT